MPRDVNRTCPTPPARLSPLLAHAFRRSSPPRHSQIDLQWNRLADEGGINIASAIKTNTTLVSLNLTGNKIRGRGASEIANALSSNPNGIRNIALPSLSSVYKDNVYLDDTYRA